MPTRMIADYTSANPLDLISSPQNYEEDSMATRFRDFKISEYWNLAWPLLIGLGAGIACHILRYWFPYHFLEVLADDLIVVAILGLTLELFAVRWLIERVAQDVAGQLAGWKLPKDLQLLIRDLVGTHIVREGLVKSYRFADPDVNGYVRIDITVRYDAINYSGHSEPFIPTIQEETFYDPEFKHMEYEVGDESIVLTRAQIAEMTTIDPKTHVKTLSGPAISIPPKDSNARCSVIVKYSVTMREEYSDVTNFGWATLGATIEVDDTPDTLEFISGGDDKVQHSLGSLKWYFNRPFIPGQHMRVWWFRKNPTPKLSASQKSEPGQ